MDEDSRRNRKCYRCHQYGHVVQECPIPKGSKLRRQRKKRAIRGVQVQVAKETVQEVSPPLSREMLTLLECIDLLDKQEWTPEVCDICGKINAKHS